MGVDYESLSRLDLMKKLEEDGCMLHRSPPSKDGRYLISVLEMGRNKAVRSIVSTQKSLSGTDAIELALGYLHGTMNHIPTPYTEDWYQHMAPPEDLREAKASESIDGVVAAPPDRVLQGDFTPEPAKTGTGGD